MFTQTRIKLMFWYVIIMMAVSLIFSVIIYSLFDREIIHLVQARRDRITTREQQIQRLAPPGFIVTLEDRNDDPVVIRELRERSINRLIMVNGLILIVMGGMAYVLAGRTLRPIQDMLERQRRFVSDASHELRTPLTSIKTATEIFLRDKKATLGETQTLLTDNLRDIATLDVMTTQLLELSRYEDMHNVQEQYVDVSLATTVCEVQEQLKTKALEKKISVNVDIPDDCIVKGEPLLLRRLFTILLDNAIKYSSTKSTVTITAKRKRNQIEAKVQDTGVGIAEQDIPHIFDRFYRGDKSRTRSRDIEGYGLGLAIAKEIVDLHQGFINIKSKPDQGSTFTVILHAQLGSVSIQSTKV